MSETGEPKEDSFAIATVTTSESGRGMMEVQREIEAACILSKKYPRDPLACREKQLVHCRRLAFADKAVWSYPRGGKPLSGPSIVLAKMMVREWGNIRYGIDIVLDEAERRKIRAWGWDMETNARFSVEDEFEKKFYRKEGGWQKIDFKNADDERTLRELTFRKGSLILRGALLGLMPADLVDDCVKQCKITTLKDASEKPIEERIKGVLDKFKQWNVDKARIERRLGYPLEQITEDDFDNLRMICNALQDGQASITEFFPTGSTGANEAAASPKDDFGNLRGAAAPTWSSMVEQHALALFPSLDTPEDRATAVHSMAEEALGKELHPEQTLSDSDGHKLAEYMREQVEAKG